MVCEFKLTWPPHVNTAALTAPSGALLSWFRRPTITSSSKRRNRPRPLKAASSVVQLGI